MRINYEVGKQFPDENYLHIGEATVAIFNNHFFDILISVYNPIAIEKKVFRKGSLEAGLFLSEGVPFIYLHFNHPSFDNFSFDVSLDITKLGEEQQTDWLNMNSNSINLFYVNAETGIIEAMRTIKITFSEDIRDILEEQTLKTTDEINKIIIKTRNNYSTNDMKKKAMKRNRF